MAPFIYDLYFAIIRRSHIDIINMKTQNENHLRKEVIHMSDDQVITITSDDIFYG